MVVESLAYGTRQATLPRLPHNVEAEAALLGALMAGDMGWLIEYAADRLAPASFFEPIHGRIFDAIVREHSLGRIVTPVVLKPYFEGDDALAQLGGVGYLARLTAHMDGLLAPKELVNQVADLANRRKVMGALLGGYQRCADLVEDLSHVVSGIDVALDNGNGDGVVEADAGDCMEALFDELDAEHVGVLCRDIEAFDELTGALEPKSLTILAARPGMGKTAVAVSYALGAASAGHGVTFVSLEMSRQQLAGRMVADRSFDDPDRRIPYAGIQKRNLSDKERDQANWIAKRIADLPLSVIDAGTLTIGRLERIVRSQKRRMAARGATLELLIVDYLQLLHPDQQKRSAYEAISEISRRLKAIAKDHDIAILALAQLSRVVETRPGNRPILADLRDSGQIEQDADAVMFLLREEYYLRQGEPHDDPDKHAEWETKLDRCRGVIEFILAKRRNGLTGTAWGRFYGPYQAVR